MLVGGHGAVPQCLAAVVYSGGPPQTLACANACGSGLRNGRPGTSGASCAGWTPKPPQASTRNDEAKLIRALEVTLLGGRPMTAQWREGSDPLPGYRTLLLGLDPPREDLYVRIDSRARRMFSEGLAGEVAALLRLGVRRTARPFRALGYAQCLQYLDGACDLETAISSTALETRRYAKRQMTWFRRRTPGVRWLRSFGDNPEATAWAAGEVGDWLGFPTE